MLLCNTRFPAARKLALLQRQPTSTLVGKARTNHVRVTCVLPIFSDNVILSLPRRIEKGKDVDELKREGSFFLDRGKKYY
jgi:hypothetical protein